jgi:tight adherence protein B
MTPVTLIAVAGGLSVVLAVYALYAYSTGVLGERARLRERLKGGRAGAGVVGEGGAGTDLLRTENHSGIPTLNALLTNLSLTKRLEPLLAQAGLKTRVGEILLIQGILASVAALFVEWRFAPPPGLSLLAGVAGAWLPLAYLKRRRARRIQAFANLLPVALDMIKSSLHAGHALTSALEVVGVELPEPLAGEFRIVLEELRLGLPARVALDNLYRRVQVEDLRFFIVAVALNREVGGNLSEVLDSLSSTLRERLQLRQKVRALSAQGRASTILMFSIPPGVGLLANVLSPGFLEPMLHHPVGRITLGIAFAFQMAGFALARRISNPKALVG